MKFIIKLLFGMIALLSASGALAFDMNPTDVDCWGKKYLCNLAKHSEKFKFPVHETITLLAYDCYEKPDACKGEVGVTH